MDNQNFVCNGNYLLFEIGELVQQADVVMSLVSALSDREEIRSAVYEGENTPEKRNIRALWEALMLTVNSNFDYADDLEYRVGEWIKQKPISKSAE